MTTPRIGAGLFKPVSDREMDERIRLLVERERRPEHDSTVRVRWVPPRPRPKPVQPRKPATMPRPVSQRRRRPPQPPRPDTHLGRLLAALVEGGPTTSTDLAARLGVSISHVNRNLRRLHARGFVERTGRKVIGNLNRALTEWKAT